MSFVCESLDLIYGGESSFAELLDWLVQLMKTILVQIFGKIFEPDLEERLTLEVEIDGLIFLSDQSEAYLFG